MEVMARKGYDGASIQEVAAAAGVTSGLIHYHFKNKEEILLAVVEVLRAQNDERLTERLQGCDAEEQLHRFIDHHLATGKDADPDSLFCWIVVSGEAMRREAVRAAYEAAVAAEVSRVREIIEAGRAAWVFSCDDPDAAASALVATIQGFFVLAATARSQIPRRSAARSARRMARGLLGGAP